MHTIEIPFTTGEADHVGHKLFPHAPWWMVPVYGTLGCGLYRKLEGGNPHDRLRKFGLDLSGILFNEVLEKL